MKMRFSPLAPCLILRSGGRTLETSISKNGPDYQRLSQKMSQFSERKPRRFQASWSDRSNNILDGLFLPNEGTGDGERSPHADAAPKLIQTIISSAYSPASKQGSFLDTSTLFPDLPIELRRSIWKFAAGPREVEIIYN